MRPYFIVRLFRKLGILPYLNFTRRKRWSKRVYRISLMGGLNEGILYSEQTTISEVLEQMIKLIDVREFVDVGVNTGQTMLEIFNFEPKIRYVGFEPNPYSFVAAHRLMKINDLPGTIYPVGLADRTKIVKLYGHDSVDAGATIRPEIRADLYNRDEGGGGALLPVSIYRFDELIDELALSKHFIMKVDVEGAELAMLRGAELTLRILRPVVLCEVLDAHSESLLAENSRYKSDLSELLTASGYKLFRARGCALEQIAKFPEGVYIRHSNCDYIFIPDEIATRL